MLSRNFKSKLFTTMGSLSIAVMLLAGAITMAFAGSPPQAARPDDITPPPLPEGLAPVPAGNVLFLVGHAIGTQNYVCVPSGAGVSFVLFTPEATLFDDEGEQIITHFFSPNPDEPNTNPKVVGSQMIRAAWQDSRDTSTVWAKLHQPNGSVIVDQDAIAWLLLDRANTPQDGPTGGDRLSGTTFIQRLNTTGGLAPSTGCTSSADLGNQAFVPYTADYFFYRAGRGN